MYTLKLKKTAPVLQVALSRHGRLVRTSRGQRLILGSLAEAQHLARTFAGYGLLS